MTTIVIDPRNLIWVMPAQGNGVRKPLLLTPLRVRRRFCFCNFRNSAPAPAQSTMAYRLLVHNGKERSIRLPVRYGKRRSCRPVCRFGLHARLWCIAGRL